MLRGTYAEVNLTNLVWNIKELKRAANTPVMAVVKADAYGHGMKEVALTAEKTGVEWFAVATPEEALALREDLPSAHILVLSPVEEQAIEPMLLQDISFTAFLPEHLVKIAAEAKRLCRPAKLHFKADTGMGRIGFRTEEELAALISILKEQPMLSIEGLFTHFATADEADHSFALIQLARFIAHKKQLNDEGLFPLAHASNSAATIWMKDAHFDLCRIGISMYGYPPSKEVEMGDVHLKPVMKIFSHIAYIKTVGERESISYGRTYLAAGEERIATIPIGYADGYRRALSNKTFVYVNGHMAKQVGRICMDQTMINVTGIPAEEGDRVEILGEHIDADRHAAYADTISYEILTGISKRMPRVYVEE